MTKPTGWSLGGEAPEPQEFPAEAYEDQQGKQPKAAEPSERGEDERGNVRPADKRAAKKTTPAKK